MEDLLHEQLKLLDYAQDINATTEKQKQLFSPTESNHFFAGESAGFSVITHFPHYAFLKKFVKLTKHYS